MSAADAAVMGGVAGVWLSIWASARLWAVARRSLWG